MSDEKQYFEMLKEELKDLPLKERLLQELIDHVDDLEQEQAASLTTQKMSKIIGEPKYIKQTYYSVLNPLRWIPFIMEGLFCGLLLLPLSLLSFFSQGLITRLLYPSSLGGDRGGLTLLMVLLVVGSIFFLWFMAYTLAFKHYRKLSKTTGYSIWAWVALIMLPTAVILGSAVIVFLKIFQECPNCNQAPVSDIASLILPVLMNLGIWSLAGYLAWKKSKRTTPKTRKSWDKRVGLILALYLIVYGVLRTGSSYGSFESFFTGQGLLDLFFMPLFFFEYFTMFLVNALGQTFVSGVWIIGFLGLVVSFLIAQCVVDLIKNRKTTWFRGGVAFWAFSLLLVNPQAYLPQIDWQKSVTSISENIEKEQHGLLYGLLKYSNQDEGRLYRYNVEWMDGEFLVIQSSGEAFKINPDTLDSVKSKMEFKNDPVTMEEGLDCSSPNLGMENVQVSDFYSCSQLSWQGEAIFNVENTIVVSGLAFSEDKKWLMLVVQSGFYNPEAVYLVEL